jgi:hypothetical protein
VDLPYEADIEHLLDFLMDDVLPLSRLLLGLLLHRPSAEEDPHMVLKHLPMDTGHL